MRERHIYEFEMRDGELAEYTHQKSLVLQRETELGYIPTSVRKICRKSTGVIHWRHIYGKRRNTNG